MAVEEKSVCGGEVRAGKIVYVPGLPSQALAWPPRRSAGKSLLHPWNWLCLPAHGSAFCLPAMSAPSLGSKVASPHPPILTSKADCVNPVLNHSKMSLGL